MRLFLWYIVASVLLGPLIGAVFTGGSTLLLYMLYFVDLKWLVWSAVPGIFFWVVHVFIRFSGRAYMKRHPLPPVLPSIER